MHVCDLVNEKGINTNAQKISEVMLKIRYVRMT